jgi:hypothetical protein
MKTVFTSSMVAHVWAQQNQGSGRNAKRSLFFEGATIYSYGHHFPIARFISHNGKKAVLFTTLTYSITTSSHCSTVHQAINKSFPVFNVDDPTKTPKPHTMKKYYAILLENAVEKAIRSRTTTEWRIKDCQRITNEGNDLAKFFGWKWRLASPRFDSKFIREAKERANKVSAKKAEETKKKKAQLLEEQKEAIIEWREGRRTEHGYGLSRLPTMLRIYNNEVQTSRGATIPLDHAIRLWPIILKVKASGQSYVHNGHSEHVGNFTVNRIEPNGDVVVGCHLIKFNELEHCAKLLGLI